MSDNFASRPREIQGIKTSYVDSSDEKDMNANNTKSLTPESDEFSFPLMSMRERVMLNKMRQLEDERNKARWGLKFITESKHCLSLGDAKSAALIGLGKYFEKMDRECIEITL